MPAIERSLLSGMLALSLASCTLGPDFEKPEAWSPASWFASPPSEAKLAEPASQPVPEPVRADWWALFGDQTLVSLEARVAAQSLDVRVATLRLAESRAQRRVAGAAALPSVNGDASYSRIRPSAKGELSLLGGSSSGSAGAGGASGAGAGGTGSAPPTGAGSSTALSPFDLYQYGFDASWELDLWGRVRRSVEAADATIEASAEARRDVLLSAMAELARDYLQLRGAQAQLAILRENLATFDETLHLTEEQAKNGMASQMDVASAAAERAGLAASIPQVEQSVAQAINQIGFLLGEPPRALAAELADPQAIPPIPPRVPVGLPSELAERRPDIREASARLHAAVAQIGVAKADFYPRIALSGSLDMQALQFKDLGSWEARTYNFGPTVSIPVFEGGRLSGTLQLREAEQQEAAITFQRTVLNAWQEVDNALTAYDKEQRRNEGLAEQVGQARRALALARQQNATGMTDYLHVLDAQRQLLAAQRQDVDSRATLSTNLVALYKALGGGWDAQ